jgi:hypothetical protein
MMDYWTNICQSLSQLLRPSQRLHPHVPILHFKHLHLFLLLALQPLPCPLAHLHPSSQQSLPPHLQQCLQDHFLKSNVLLQLPYLQSLHLCPSRRELKHTPVLSPLVHQKL